MKNKIKNTLLFITLLAFITCCTAIKPMNHYDDLYMTNQELIELNYRVTGEINRNIYNSRVRDQRRNRYINERVILRNNVYCPTVGSGNRASNRTTVKSNRSTGTTSQSTKRTRTVRTSRG